MRKRVTHRAVERSIGKAFRQRTLTAILAAAAMAGVYAYQQQHPALAISANGVTVHDGDTITVNGQRIRMQGIDAPELAQTCKREGQSWPCGEAAKQALITLIGDAQVSCTEEGRDGYGRLLSYCFAGETNLNAALVRQGYAVAYRRYDTRFVADEDAARREKAGIWAGRFILPEQWRREKGR